MKNIISILIITLTIITFTSCSNDTVNDFSENNELSEKWSKYLLDYSDSKLQNRNTSLYNQLDHSSNYENSIFYFITQDQRFNVNDTIIYTSTSSYDKHTEFDKDLIEDIFNEFKALDASSFFTKMDYFENFIKAEVVNLEQKDYLLSFIEETKWVKYSTNEMANRTNNFDACFDSCMEDKIESNLQNVVDWAWFLWNPGMSVAQWASSCTWDCW